MGTRSMTIFLEDNKEVARMYRQYDGYPEAHGVELAKLCKKVLVNGYSDPKSRTQANGMGCLAAQVIAKLKTGIGNIYIEPTGGEISDWVEYIYTVRSDGEGKVPIIEISTQSGPFPFNLQNDAFLFRGSPKALIAKWYKSKKKTGNKNAA
jgi:hypothetical protein